MRFSCTNGEKVYQDLIIFNGMSKIDVPGCVEIVENGINGLIVKSKNVYELEKAIFAPTIIQRIRSRKVITKFDARIINRNNLNVYEYKNIFLIFKNKFQN